MSRTLFYIPVCAFLMIFIFFGVCSAEDIGYFTLNIGSSFRMGDGGANWLAGSNISTAWTYRINSTFYSGLNLGYGSWSPCCSKITEDFNSAEKRWASEGSYDVVEIAPYVRIFPEFINSGKYGGYFQLGAGSYIVEANWSVTNRYGLEHNYFGDKNSETDFGFNIGGGFIFGDRARTHYEINPKYNILLDGGGTIGYLGLSLGLL